MIDTHCHIYLPDFHDDLTDVLDRAFLNGVHDILMPAIDWISREQMLALPPHKIRLHRMAGIHPCDVRGSVDEQKLMDWASESDVVAIGESGLDYFWSKEFIPEQKTSLRLHCRLARELEKPIVLHNRESTADLLKIVAEEQDGRLRGVWHCFNGTEDEARQATDLGLHLGIGGVVTFKNGGVDKTVAQIPLEHLILETDAPYLAPVPIRGKRNEPSYTLHVAIKLSEIFGCPLAEIDKITSETARKLFRL
jgi:TatD DNase family protein